MKVCYVADYAKKVSGSGQSLLDLIAELKKDGVEPYIVCHRPCELLEIAEERGIHTQMIGFKIHVIPKRIDGAKARLKDIAKRVYNRALLREATGFLRDNGIDIVHLNSLLSADIWALAARKAGIAYVWHIREYMGSDHDRVILNMRQMMRYLAQADAVIAISRSVKDHWDPRFHGSAQLIYNGLSTETYSAGDSKFRSDIVRCLIVGRVVEGKGQMDAVRALERALKAGKSNLRLTIVGFRAFDPYELRLKDYIEEHGLGPYIDLVDFTYDMAPYRESSDIGLMCSRAEAFGRVTIEYMMSGLLVFGTNAGGTPELIRDGTDGYLYEFGDSEQLARLMICADENRAQARAMAKRGQAKAMERFTIGRTAQEVLKVYDTIKNKRGGMTV